jgi:hypothetical protein
MPLYPDNSALLLINHHVGTMQLIKTLDVEHACRREASRWRRHCSRAQRRHADAAISD